jgi:hypothetical protein
LWSRNNELDYGNKQDRDYYKQASEKLEGGYGQFVKYYLHKLFLAGQK